MSALTQTLSARLLAVAALLLFSCCASVARGVTMNLISDMHLDPDYGTARAYGVCVNSSFPPTGYKGCDAPISLINLIVTDAVNQYSVYTLYGGDWQRHGMSATSLTTANVFSALAPSFSLIGASSPASELNTPRVGTTLGNNDMMPDYAFNVSELPHAILDTQIGIMEDNGILTADEGAEMAKCGFYSRNATTTLRIAVLHTLIWTYRLNPPLDDANTDPCGQFAWLAAEISSARAAGQKIIILSHIPPLPDVFSVIRRGAVGTAAEDMYWKPAFQKTYTSLLSNNQEVVAMQIYGHTHRFSLLADTEMGVPLAIINSVTPIFGNNPAYMIGDFDESTWRLTSLKQRYLDTSGGTVQLTPGLEVTNAMNIRNLSNIDDVRSALNDMFTNDTAWSHYTTLRTGGVVDDPCTTAFCRVYTICAMMHASHDSISTCVAQHSAAFSNGSSSSIEVCTDTVPYFTAAQQSATRSFLAAFSAAIPALRTQWRCNNFCGWAHVTCDATTVSVSFPSSGLVGTLPAVPLSTTAALQVMVTRISLGGNPSITGTLPPSWGMLTAIKYLALQSTGVTGTLPTEWSGLRNLETFYAYNTALSGSLPSTWSTMMALKIFTVSLARLSGTLPASWSAMASLQTLTLTSNAFSGSVPASWGAMTALRTVRIAGNSFCGCLPTQWQTGMISVVADPALQAADCATANSCALTTTTTTTAPAPTTTSTEEITNTTTTTTTTAAPVDPSVHITRQPIYHIRPPKNWINDPNGPYRDPVTGKIHLFMQYSPNGPLLGDIAWYHVTSDDYVKWEQPDPSIAMYADKWYDKWGAYSGTMMNNNHSEPVVMYTCAEPENIQRQCIATIPARDLAGKRTLNSFAKSPRNPLLTEDNVPGLVGLGNFRDPTEWWEDPAHPGQWLVAFAARINDAEGDNAHVIVFRTSDPTFQSGYTFSHSLYVYKYDLDKMFECPDFFTLQSGGAHFLKVSTMPSHRDYIIYGDYALDSASGNYVFVEDPDRSFTFIDYGPFYASKTFHDPILNRRMIWGWTNDELSDAQITANGWSGVQNMLRTVEYDATEKKLKTAPVPETKGLRLNKLVDVTSVPVTSTPTQIVASNTNNTLYHEIIATFTLSDPSVFSATAYYAADGSDAPEVGVMIRANSNLSQYATVSVRMPPYGPQIMYGNEQEENWPPFKIFAGPGATNCSNECTKLRLCESFAYLTDKKICKLYWRRNPMGANVDAASGVVREPLLYLARDQSKSIGWISPLSGRAPFASATPNGFQLHIFVDDSVLEIFKDGGLETMTGRLYIDNGANTTGVAVYAKNMGNSTVTADVQVYTMDTIWATPAPNAVRNFTNSLYNLLDTLVDA